MAHSGTWCSALHYGQEKGGLLLMTWIAQVNSFVPIGRLQNRGQVRSGLGSFFSLVFRNFCVRRGGGRRRPARDGAARLRAPAATNAKIEKRGGQASERPGVRTPGRPGVRASGRPSIRTSGRPDVRASERPSVRASERPSVENGVEKY